jgi:polyphosphate kinase
VPLEEIIAHQLDSCSRAWIWSPGHLPGHPQRGLEVEEDDAENILHRPREGAAARKVGRPPVRLEVEEDIHDDMLAVLRSRARRVATPRCSACPHRFDLHRPGSARRPGP